MKDFRVLLVAPIPSTDLTDCYGARILSSCLKKEGCDVRIIFLPRIVGEMYEDRTLDEIAELSRDCDLAGVSLMTDDFPNAVRITQRIKKDSNIPIVWGGIHPTIKPQECLEHVDMVCRGEGEETFVELAGKIRDGKNPLDIQGMWFRDKGQIIENRLRPLIQGLDSVPFPDNDLSGHYVLVKNHYLMVDRHIHRVNEKLLKDIWGRCYLTLASRGCHFSCTYCWNHVNNKMYAGQQVIRKRSTGNIIEELKAAKERLTFSQAVWFNDDLFFVRTEDEITDFARKYKKEINLPLWISGASPSNLTREKLSVLVDAGLVDIRMGIQTASERTKAIYRRYHTNQQIEKTVCLINEFKKDIKVPKYDIILDNPWEAEDDLIETLMFLARLKTPYQLALHTLTLYPGTDLYEKARTEGMPIDTPGDAWQKSHHKLRVTYLNKLFVLLRYYVPWAHVITPPVMYLLTNRRLRQLRISWCLYGILKAGGVASFWIQYYLVEGCREIRKGNWSRIIRFGKRFFNVQKHRLHKD